MTCFTCTKCGGTFDPAYKWCPNCDQVMVEHTEELRRFNDLMASQNAEAQAVRRDTILTINEYHPDLGYVPALEIARLHKQISELQEHYSDIFNEYRELLAAAPNAGQRMSGADYPDNFSELEPDATATRRKSDPTHQESSGDNEVRGRDQVFAGGSERSERADNAGEQASNVVKPNAGAQSEGACSTGLAEAGRSERADAALSYDRPAAAPTPDDLWLHKFITCAPFGADAPQSDSQRAHQVVRDLTDRIEQLVEERKSLSALVDDLDDKCAELERELAAARKDVERYHSGLIKYASTLLLTLRSERPPRAGGAGRVGDGVDEAVCRIAIEMREYADAAHERKLRGLG